MSEGAVMMVTTKKQQQKQRGVVLYYRNTVKVRTCGMGYCTVDTGYSTTANGKSHTRYELLTSGLRNRPSPQKNESVYQKGESCCPILKMHIIATVITKRQKWSLHIQN